MLWWGKGKMAVTDLFEELERALVTLSGYVWVSSERCYLEAWDSPIPYLKSYRYLELNNLILNSSYFLPNLSSVLPRPLPHTLDSAN